jgi:cytochrome c553
MSRSGRGAPHRVFVAARWLLPVALFAAAVPPLLAQSPQEIADLTHRVFAVTPVPAEGAAGFWVCAGCHGPGGNGDPAKRVPAIAGQHQRVVAKQLIDYQNHARWDASMEQVADRHRLVRPEDFANLAAHVASLPRAAQRETGNGRDTTQGRALYRASCAECHGTDGEGNGVTLVPMLAGQHFSYLRRQLADTLEGRRPNMPPPHADLLSGADAQRLDGLADYLSRLQPARRVVGSAPR